MANLAKVEPQETLPADPMISMIERLVMDPNADLTKLERMLEMKERHEAAQSKAQFSEAFARASASFPTIPLNGKSNNGKYATLEDITKFTRPVLSEHGLTLNFSIKVDQDVVVTAKLSHKSGYSEETSIALPRDTSGSKNAVQAVGSTQTYGQRYTAQAILGLSLGQDTEDDGNAGPNPPSHADSWAKTVVQDLPPSATDKDKARAICDALIAQWGRKTSERQLFNEWDRRSILIEGDNGLEGKFPAFYNDVLAAYEARIMALKEDDQ